MPPASNPVSASSKSKSGRFSNSPDSESSLPDPIPPVSSKKKKKNGANKQSQTSGLDDRPSALEIARPESPPPAPAPTRPHTILSQIGHGFPNTTRKDSTLLDVEDEAPLEKVSDQYTPPNDDWLGENIYSKPVRLEQNPRAIYSTSPPVRPGFTPRASYASKSPPISPPVRYLRPVSHGDRIPPIPAIPRSSPISHGYAPSGYGSPPAPHLPQKHFYQAQDVNLGVPRTSLPQFREEPCLVKYTRLPSKYGVARHGTILGYDGRLNIVRYDGATFEELGTLEGLTGTVIDAVLLEGSNECTQSNELAPMIAVVIHGPKSSQSSDIEGIADTGRPSSRQQTNQLTIEYSTRVEVFSLSKQELLAVLLETPTQLPQAMYRGAPLAPPSPFGQLRMQASGSFLIVSSGTSGEIYAFTMIEDSKVGFECLGKFWAAIQPQVQRRDSSRHQSSDADISPADLSRASGPTERPILTINGRWLAIVPSESPTRTSLGAVLGVTVLCGRQAGIDSTSAPARPSVTCEVDSPDADTILGKVARGVAQELVKGAKWLGDQGYQTWQSYWKKDQSSLTSGASPVYSPPIQPVTYGQNVFPPTHGEGQHVSKDPELITIYDLQTFRTTYTRKVTDEVKPLATFQPPRGCSFLSLAPQGLTLLTASRKGDVQYVWDLMQIKNCRTQITSVDDERIRLQPRVRQVAKYERLSGSTIVDVIWDRPAGSRFAVLTKNKTIHLFDLPTSAFRWPPPRNSMRSRLNSKSVDNSQNEPSIPNGFFASAMSIANQAQPVLASWRGRAPSMGASLAGLGQTGIGFASATGAMGSKAVAAGLSKSLGAASDTVNHIRHAGESRLHLRTNKAPVFGRIYWSQQGRKHVLVVLDTEFIRIYQVHRNRVQEKRDRDYVTVFAALKAVALKLPIPARIMNDDGESAPDETETRSLSGFWKLKINNVPQNKPLSHPLSFAEIETNAPYQPFHSDRRVTMAVYADDKQMSDSQLPSASVMLNAPMRSKTRPQAHVQAPVKWVFGDEVPTITLNINKIKIPEEDDENSASIMYRETIKLSSPSAEQDGMDQIVSTTRRRKIKKSQSMPHDTESDLDKEDGFFEDDCDVLDFATDRV